MTSRDFAFWLQGFFEIQKPDTLSAEQIDLIQRHLNLVFIHDIDPSMGNKQHQDVLNEIHNKIQFPKTEEQAIELFGPKPSPNHEFNLHGWYNPNEAIPRC